MGINIIVCGTCVQHFNRKENVAIGTISNMYDILEILSRSNHVVTPYYCLDVFYGKQLDTSVIVNTR